MADKETNEAKISIKVIVDKLKKRVVYADEADYTFVDILFSFMTLPLGTIVKLLGKLEEDNKFEALGSLNNLYKSLKDFPECYLATEECKDLLLNPKSLSYTYCNCFKLKLDDTLPLKYYNCGSCSSSHYVSGSNKAKCYSCQKPMKHEFGNFISYAYGGVFVSEIANFIVTDDLCVMPYTSATIIQLLTSHGITDMNRLEDVNLELDSEKMLFLLKVALSLKFPLIHLVFCSSGSARDLTMTGLSSITGVDETKLTRNEQGSSSQFVLEVCLQKSTGMLLFAEAREDFIEFLFGLLSIPLGTVVGELLKGESSLRCMENIFKSISDMRVDVYLKCENLKNRLLHPEFGQNCVGINLDGTGLSRVKSVVGQKHGS